MRINEEQLRHYEEQGYLLLPGYFSPAEVEAVRSQLPHVLGREGRGHIAEKEGEKVRSVYGAHLENETFRRLSLHPRLVEPSIQMLGGGVYVYQVKVNAKMAFGGDVWDWHQDYIYWRNLDGMPAPRVTNAALFLDDATEFNGPMYLIPGSHKEGCFSLPDRDRDSARVRQLYDAYRDAGEWISSLTAELKYSFDREAIAALVGRYGLISVKAPAGSVLYFHPDIVHASPHNISPFDRVSVVVTYNSVENVPRPKGEPRPEFLVGRNHEPVVPLGDDALLQTTAGGR